jgi:hypothetical protein
MQKVILIDLDGVLNNYKGIYTPENIPEARVGVQDFLERLSAKFTLKLFTTREKWHAQQWLIDNDLQKYFKEITNVKEPAWLFLDDRCIQFNGNYSDTLKQIFEYKVWYKK